MDEITSQILRSGTFAIAVAAVILTFFTRRVVENVFPKWKQDKSTPGYDSKMEMWWNSVILYAIPVVYGCLLALVDSDWLHGEMESVGARVMFGGGVGWFSSFLYKIFRKVILQKTGVDIQPSASIVPDEPGEKPEE